MTHYLFYDDKIANSRQLICKVGYVCTDEQDKELFRHDELIDPECRITKKRMKALGVFPEDLWGLANFERFCATTGFIRLLRRCVFVSIDARADLRRIRDSLARYEMPFPIIRFVDLQQMAGRVEGLEGASVQAICDHYGIAYKPRQDTLVGALCCRDIFRHLRDDLEGDVTVEEYVSRRRIFRPEGSEPLGCTADTKQAISEVLAEFDQAGLLRSAEEIVRFGPGPMFCSGQVSKDLLQRCKAREFLKDMGYQVPNKLSNASRFLAIGDAAGSTSIEGARQRQIPVVSLHALILELLGSDIDWVSSLVVFEDGDGEVAF